MIQFSYYYSEHRHRALPLGELIYFRQGFRAALKQSQVIFTNSDFSRTSVEEAARIEGLSAPPSWWLASAL